MTFRIEPVGRNGDADPSAVGGLNSPAALRAVAFDDGEPILYLVCRSDQANQPSFAGLRVRFRCPLPSAFMM
jgi:hypothetical protein